MKVYIVVYSHKHGITTWPEFQDEPLTVDDVIEGLTDWHPEDESIQIEGPFAAPTRAEAHPLKHYQVELLRGVLQDFCSWHANHFEDFSSDVNAQLLCLANDAASALEATK